MRALDDTSQAYREAQTSSAGRKGPWARPAVRRAARTETKGPNSRGPVKGIGPALVPGRENGLDFIPPARGPGGIPTGGGLLRGGYYFPNREISLVRLVRGPWGPRAPQGVPFGISKGFNQPRTLGPKAARERKKGKKPKGPSGGAGGKLGGPGLTFLPFNGEPSTDWPGTQGGPTRPPRAQLGLGPKAWRAFRLGAQVPKGEGFTASGLGAQCRKRLGPGPKKGTRGAKAN